MDEVILALVLPHCQLKLTYCFIDLYLKDHVHCLRLGQSIVQLKYFIASQMAELITRMDSLAQVLNCTEHNLSAQ